MLATQAFYPLVQRCYLSERFHLKYSIEQHFWDISTLKMIFTVLMKSLNFAKPQLKSVKSQFCFQP